MELWTSGRSCTLPSLPRGMSSHTVDVLDSKIVACDETSCLQFTGGSWSILTRTTERGFAHTSAVIQSRLYLVGGEFSSYSPDSPDSPDSTEIVTSDGAVEPGFSLQNGRWRHCSIQTQESVVLTGGRDTLSLVTEYSDIQGDVRVRELHPLAVGRAAHACEVYRDTAGSQVTLIVSHSSLTVSHSTQNVSHFTYCVTLHTHCVTLHTHCVTLHTHCVTLHTHCVTLHTHCVTVHTHNITHSHYRSYWSLEAMMRV